MEEREDLREEEKRRKHNDNRMERERGREKGGDGLQIN